jgi:hypothetical protein
MVVVTARACQVKRRSRIRLKWTRDICFAKEKEAELSHLAADSAICGEEQGNGCLSESALIAGLYSGPRVRATTLSTQRPGSAKSLCHESCPPSLNPTAHQTNILRVILLDCLCSSGFPLRRVLLHSLRSAKCACSTHSIVVEITTVRLLAHGIGNGLVCPITRQLLFSHLRICSLTLCLTFPCHKHGCCCGKLVCWSPCSSWSADLLHPSH